VPKVVATAPTMEPPLATASSAPAEVDLALRANDRARRVEDPRAKSIVDNLCWRISFRTRWISDFMNAHNNKNSLFHFRFNFSYPFRHLLSNQYHKKPYFHLLSPLPGRRYRTYHVRQMDDWMDGWRAKIYEPPSLWKMCQR
jgi:hypothetical protein